MRLFVFCQQFLLRFLRNVVENPDNRMMLNSVAMIVAPNLFIVKTGRGTDSKMEGLEVELQMAERTSRVVMMMIENQETIFTVSLYELSDNNHLLIFYLSLT